MNFINKFEILIKTLEKDSGKGIISYNTKLKLYDIPLKEMVEQQFGLPTYLDNDN